MAKKIEIPIEVVDKFSKNLNSLDGRLNTISKSAEKQQTAFNLLSADIILRYGSRAASAVVNFAKSSLDSFARQEQATKSLEIAMKNLGVYSKKAIKDQQDFASSLQRVTTVGDEETLELQALLTTFGLYGKKLNEATLSTVDFAKAQGVDLKSAALLVGKAFVGETSALSRYGIVIEEGLSKTQKFEAVIAQLNNRFAGTAQAEMETYAGKVKSLENAWDDLKERLGELLQGPAEDLINWGRDFVTVADFVIERLEKMEKKTIFERTTESAKKLSIWLLDLAGKYGIVSTSVAGMANVILATTEIKKQSTAATREEMSVENAAAMALVAAAQAKIAATKQYLIEKTATNQFISEFEIAGAESEIERFDMVAVRKMEILRQSVTDQEQIERARNTISEAREKLSEKIAKKRNADKAQSFMSTMQFISQAANSENKKLAMAGKAAAIITSTINTYKAIGEAMASAPFPWCLPLMAAVGAIGFQNVANIQAQGFEKGGRPPIGRDVIVGENGPERFRADRGGRIIPNQQITNIQNGDTSGAMSQTFNITVYASSSEPDEIVSAISEAFKTENFNTIAASRRIANIANRHASIGV